MSVEIINTWVAHCGDGQLQLDNCINEDACVQSGMFTEKSSIEMPHVFDLALGNNT
jgi:hypothetical protein